MPFKPAPESQVPIDKYIPVDLQRDDPSVVDIAAALWRTENTLGSYLNQEEGLPDVVDDRSFNPYDFMSEEEKSNKQFVVNAALTDSEDEMNAVRRQQARERKDRETIANGGAISVALGLGVGFTDPVNFIPIGGAVARTYKTGGSILKSAAVTGSVTAASTAIQEAALHATQLERTYGESAVNVGAGAFLGGVLGFGVGKLAQYIDERQIEEIAKSMEPESRILAGEDSVILSTPPVDPSLIRQSFMDILRLELTPVAGNKLTRGERKDLLAQRRALKEQMNKVEAVVEAAPKIPGVPARKAKQQAVEQAEALAAQERQAIQDQLNIVNTRLKDDDVAKAAEGNLTRLEQGIVPKEYQSRLDEIILENERATSAPITKPAGEPVTPEELRDPNYVETPSLQKQAADEGISAADLSAGAMKVANGEEVKGKVGKFLVKAFSFDPLSRTITSVNPETRTLANLLAENPIAMDRGGVTAVESRIKIKDGYYVAALVNHLDRFRAYKKAGGNLNRLKFNEAVARALRNDASDIPEALESARSWRSNLYDPLKNEAIEVGLLPEDVDVTTAVTTAVGYLNRRWNKEKIVANYDEFLSVVSKWLKDKDIELRAEAERARVDVESATGAEKTRLQAIIDKSDFKEQLDLEDMEYEDIARQIAQRIKGSPDGRLPYDWKIGEGSSGNKLNGTPMRGPLRSRTFQIPDNLVEDFLENNIEDLGRIYLRQIAPDIEIKRQFPEDDIELTDEIKKIEQWYSDAMKFPEDDIELTDEIKKIEQWYSDAMKRAKTKREKDVLEKAKNSDIEDIAGMRDRIRGVYAMEDPNNIFHRAGRVARNWNYLRLMGGVVASSVPDVARIFMAEGIGKTFSKGLVPLAKNLKTFQVSAAEGKRYGIGVDALMGGRSQIISDISDYTKGGTKFERGVQSLTDNFGRINLMDYWTAGVKQLHIVTMQNSVIDGLLKGKIDKRLSRLGIDDGNASAISEQLKKYAEKVDGVWLSNAKNWDNPELEQIWGAALRKESDRVIVVPGQEKPLFMSTPMGKTILQFRSFMFSSTQRMTIAALQGQDHNALGGVLMLTTLGMMSYAFKQKDAGREITDDPIALVIEGIDRSGALGGIMEINNTMEKISSNNFGLRPLLGADLPAARFASRSIADGLMGPTFGSGIDLVARVANAGLGEDDWTESDTRALRRLIPGQNLTFIRNGFDEVEKQVGDL
jgi:hypothetical protein